MIKENKKPKVIVIVGPTASGKTATSIKVAKELNGEIVSADSMQIYKDMNIGTAKPTKEEMEGIKHYMIDIVSPNEIFNVAKYKEMAEKAIEDILSENKVPIVVGGTGLYVDTLVNGVEFASVKEDLEYRNAMLERAKKEGNKALHDELAKIDKEAAEKIDMNNVRRVIRALEIYKITGKTKTKLDEESRKETKYDYRVYGIEWDREELYRRIEKRIDIMLEEGLVEEVKNVMSKYTISKTALQGLGYKEVIEFLNNDISYDGMVDKLKMETRRYAKRQLTWMRTRDCLRVDIYGKSEDELLSEVLSLPQVMSITANMKG